MTTHSTPTNATAASSVSTTSASATSAMTALLDEALARQFLRPLDVEFARMLSDEHVPQLQLAAAALSAAAGAGHVCLPLSALQPDTLFEARDPALAHHAWTLAGQLDDAGWQQQLLASPAVSDSTHATPLVLQYQRLYLQRNWLSEVHVAAFFSQGTHIAHSDPTAISEVLNRLFPPQDADIDWQKVAAAVALTRRVAVISGGPGTGKTTTVAKLLAAMIMLHRGEKPLRIQLAAPTGKAAARLTESLGSALGKLPLDNALQGHLPREATTLHRLLGAMPDSLRLRYHQGNPLHLDVLVVDEASMVDLPMMANLILALPASARVIFLGDRDQLASVEAGAVLGDVCRFAARGYSPARVEELAQLTGYRISATSSEVGSSVADSLCLLQKSYRFDQHSGIGVLARAVNDGNERQVRQVLHSDYTDISCQPLAHDDDYQQMLAHCVAGYRDYLQAVNRAQPARAVLALFQRFRQLCALRDGPFGVTGLNQRIELALQQAGLIQRSRNPLNPWYVGRPVMIARNDALLGVFNGDIGIAMLNEQHELRVYFQLPDGDMKAVSPSRLPPHETAYAMTVHKSQGSEFDHTALVLPDRYLPVLTRELIYTAVTRAKARLSLYADINVLCRAVKTPTQRYSGLEQRLLTP